MLYDRLLSAQSGGFGQVADAKRRRQKQVWGCGYQERLSVCKSVPIDR